MAVRIGKFVQSVAAQCTPPQSIFLREGSQLSSIFLSRLSVGTLSAIDIWRTETRTMAIGGVVPDQS